MRGVIFLAILALSAHEVSAQICTGSTPFANGPVRIGATLTTTDGATSYGGSLAVGASRGAFASAGFSLTDVDGIDDNVSEFGLTVGYAASLTPTHRAQICPMVHASYSSLPELTDGTFTADFSARTFGIGAAIGFVASESETLMLVPSVSGGVFSQRVSASFRDGAGGQLDDSESDTYGVLGVGIGLILNRVAMIQPFASLPLGIEGSDAAFGVTVGFSFGRTN